jgi:microcystin-dependent protein
MTSAYTTRIRLTKQGSGDNDSTWGTVLNDEVIDLTDFAIAGYTTISLAAADVSLTTNDGSADQARSAMLELSGILTAARTVYLPAVSKMYVVRNNTSGAYSATVLVNGGTGYAVPQGQSAVIYCDAVSVRNTGVIDSPVSIDSGTFNSISVITSLSFKDTDNGNFVALQAPTSVSSNISFTLPEADGTSGQVMQTDGSGVLSFISITGIPTGTVNPYAGTTAPSDWLLCYGQAINRTTYSALFSVISTTYGIGDGSTTFNLPDLRGRVVAGQDDMGGTSADRLTGQSGGVDGDTLGAAGGAEQHQLTIAELANHTHDYNYANSFTSFAQGDSTPGNARNASQVSYPTAATGGDNAHNNVQPTFILNYIIKT